MGQYIVQFLICQSAFITHHAKESILVRLFPMLRPVHHRGVPHHFGMGSVSQEEIQGRPIGIGRFFTDRRVLSLLSIITVGAEGRRIEGNQIGPAALCTEDTLDFRMERGNGHVLFSGNEALSFDGVLFSAAGTVVPFPGIADFRDVRNVLISHMEKEIGTAQNILQIGLNQRIVSGSGCIPVVKIGKNGSGLC